MKPYGSKAAMALGRCIWADVLPAGKAHCGAQPSRAKRGPTREARHSSAREARSAAAEGGGPRRRRRPPPKAAGAVRRPRAARGLQTKTRGDSTARDSAAADLTRMHAFPGSSALPAQVSRKSVGAQGSLFSRKSVRTQGSLLVGLRSFAPRPYHAHVRGRSFPLDEHSGFSASELSDITNTMFFGQSLLPARRI